jgi:hypothetical protein
MLHHIQQAFWIFHSHTGLLTLEVVSVQYIKQDVVLYDNECVINVVGVTAIHQVVHT